MYTDLYKNVPDMSKLVDYLDIGNVFSSTRDIVELNAHYMGELLDSQVDLAKFYVDSGEKALLAISEVKDYQGLVMKQKDIAEEFATKVTDIAERNVKLAQDTGKEIQTLLNRNLQAIKVEAAKPVKAAQKKAA
jgi:hypothetical protein